MKRTKKNALPEPETQAPIQTQTPVPETDEERQARVNRANKAIREVLQNENCTLMIRTLDISTGKIVPKITVEPLSR